MNIEWIIRRLSKKNKVVATKLQNYCHDNKIKTSEELEENFKDFSKSSLIGSVTIKFVRAELEEAHNPCSICGRTDLHFHGE